MMSLFTVVGRAGARTVRRVRIVLGRAADAGLRVLRDAWSAHDRLMRTSPAYDAVIVGAAIEFARSRGVRELLPIAGSALLGIFAVLAQRARSQSERGSGPLGPEPIS